MTRVTRNPRGSARPELSCWGPVRLAYRAEMSCHRLRLSLAFALLPVVACGGDDDGGGGDENLCPEMTTPSASIESYPGEYSGTTMGGGADLSVAEMGCADEGAGWYEPVGEDVVVALANLTPGQLYGVVLDSGQEDLGYYVVSGCDVALAGPAPGECMAFNDGTDFGEAGAFSAPESGDAWVVVDSANLSGEPPATGQFTLRVVEAECTPDDNTCAAPTPACVDFQCVECASSFDCASADEPVCIAGNTCEAGYSECTGDDANDDGAGGNDGPAAATAIDEPTEGNETVVQGAVCSAPVAEGNGITVEEDFYTFELTAAATVGFELTWEGANDLDLILFDGAGNIVNFGLNEGAVPEQLVSDLEPGTYYISTYLYDPAGETASVAYTLTARLAECETSFDCIDAADEPVCSLAAACSAGTSECTGDDAGDGGGSDDGPGGGRSLTGAVGNQVSLAGSICNVPPEELDFYEITTTEAGQGLVVELAFDDGAADMDLAVFDAQGRFMGGTFWVQPEVITLTRLPVGTYYAQVLLYEPEAEMAAVDYTISSTRTAADACTVVADCADEYTTQIFRGVCTGGACDFFEGEGNVATGDFCDSNSDCEVACSYLAYESDAQDSVCIDACNLDADCDAQGDGLTCTTGGDVNFCVPACTTDLECGANTTSSNLDDGQPWDYRTCDVDTGRCAL